MSEKKHIIAKLKHILYPKGGLKKTLGEEGNKFGIIKVIDEFEEVYTIKGNFPCPIDGGVEYDFTVKEEDDPKYGTTYKLLFFQSNVDMTKIPNQKEFLKKILTNKQIDALYAAYDDVLTILENGDIDKLMAVKGIGSSTAHRIISKYTGAKPDAELYVRIAELGLDFTDSMVTRLKETFGNTQVIMDVLENHPYKLVKVPLVGFKKADAIALASGRFDWQSPERIAGFIENSLDMESDNGQSYIYASELNQYIIDFFGEEIVVKYPDGTSNVGKAIQMLIDSKVISMIEDESGSKARRKVYLTKVYELEKNIAIELRRISEGEPRCFMAENWREKVQEQEKNQGFKFDESQWEAIEKGLQSNVFVIGGYGGTGKTTMLKGILAALGNATIATCALSGRAAANLQGIGRNATIHKLLDYRPGSGFQYGKHAPLPYDIIILDELSMVGGELFLSLLKAIGTGSRFICLGDPGQLESIGLLCLMRDLLNDENIPSTLLTKVHRQALESGILEESINIREGVIGFEGGIHEGVEIHGARKDFCTDFNTYRDINPSRVVAWYKKLMNSSVVKSLLDIMVISPTNIRGEDSVWKLNRLIQDEINPVVNVDADDVIPINTAIDRTSLDYIHRGDVVMVRKNNYRVNDWNGEETAMFNGWRGIIKEIDNTMVYIDFAENGKVRLDRGEAAQYLLLGYACTAHKSQGSTIPVVIATFSYSAYVMLNRNILYTAITRAKEKCVVVAETNAYVKCVQTEFVSSKRTFFAEGLLNKIFKGE